MRQWTTVLGLLVAAICVLQAGPVGAQATGGRLSRQQKEVEEYLRRI